MALGTALGNPWGWKGGIQIYVEIDKMRNQHTGGYHHAKSNVKMFLYLIYTRSLSRFHKTAANLGLYDYKKA